VLFCSSSPQLTPAGSDFGEEEVGKRDHLSRAGRRAAQAKATLDALHKIDAERLKRPLPPPCTLYTWSRGGGDDDDGDAPGPGPSSAAADAADAAALRAAQSSDRCWQAPLGLVPGQSAASAAATTKEWRGASLAGGARSRRGKAGKAAVPDSRAEAGFKGQGGGPAFAALVSPRDQAAALLRRAAKSGGESSSKAGGSSKPTPPSSDAIASAVTALAAPARKRPRPTTAADVADAVQALLDAPRAASTQHARDAGKVLLREERLFAGSRVTVERRVDADSKEAKRAAALAQAAVRAGGGPGVGPPPSTAGKDGTKGGGLGTIGGLEGAAAGGGGTSPSRLAGGADGSGASALGSAGPDAAGPAALGPVRGGARPPPAPFLPPPVRATPLQRLVAQLKRGSKVSVVDKTRADWEAWKRAQAARGDTRVDEELEAHRKSGGTYLARQAFLAEARTREYEQERDARLAGDVRTRGRV